MVASALIALVLIVLTVMLHYEGLRGLSFAIERRWLPPRPSMVLVIFGVIAIHLVEIALYGIAYWVATERLHLGSFVGTRPLLVREYLYFSAETFATLGMGDIYPRGDMRIVASIESLNGLLLIGWSGSFTYLAMQQSWSLHPPSRPTPADPAPMQAEAR